MRWANGSPILLEGNEGTNETTTLKMNDEATNTVINPAECGISRHLEITLPS